MGLRVREVRSEYFFTVYRNFVSFLVNPANNIINRKKVKLNEFSYNTITIQVHIERFPCAKRGNGTALLIPTAEHYRYDARTQYLYKNINIVITITIMIV